MAFSVDVGDFIGDLKHNALNGNPQEGVSPGELRVWRCKCYDSKLKVLSNELTLVLSDTRELDRVPSTK